MIWSSNEIVTVFVFLLPGFISAAVFHSLTSHPRPDTFRSVIQALVFTVIVQAIAALVKSHAWEWTVDQELVVLVLTSVGVGFVSAVVSNLNLVHWPLLKLRLTREKSYSSEWYSAFVHNPCYVVLHLSDGRRLYGWPAEWPTDPNNGHFHVTKAEWLSDKAIGPDQRTDGCLPVQTEDKSAESREILDLLISVVEVRMVEFVSTTKESIWRKSWQKLQRILPKGR